MNAEEEVEEELGGRRSRRRELPAYQTDVVLYELATCVALIPLHPARQLDSSNSINLKMDAGGPSMVRPVPQNYLHRTVQGGSG